MSDPSSIDAIDAWLPQTQCRQCGYAGCRPYAEAIAQGVAQIDRCPPGGDVTLAGLAALLGRPTIPLNPEVGARPPRQRARIDELVCTGCRLCIEACPVDAIVGAAKRMHTVIAQSCTGCGLCLPPCPVDCIALIAITPQAGARWPDFTDDEVAAARAAHHAQRLRRARKAPAARGFDRARAKLDIAAAVARARARQRG